MILWKIPLCLVAAAIVAPGCVTSAETKLASSQMKVAIGDYSRNVREFQQAWIAEIDRAIEDMSDALVKRSVSGMVEKMSQKGDWSDDFDEKGLIELSRQIEAEQKRARGFVALLQKADLKGDPKTILSDLEANALKARDALVKRYEKKAEKGGEEGKKARENAKKLKEAHLLQGDSVTRSYATQILEWRKLRKAIPGDMKDLRNVIAALEIAHSTVDQWIQTDVSAPGRDVGALVTAWDVALEGK